ncbi:DUF1127 domain-containing protein [Loktanella sp. D2R18]|uniref:DUF1127 domain-containing protein n=1 Tax=Rhodobacterales TaxID=204455 RepID=UPI000DE91D19|nr:MULTISPECIES: DUF1127 domain-containing protein [Rhodobacterales]MDO6590079.1 DUF1127 domain-containing protein [Yoonia sp. 1_MG-2023]RBW45796.1 DUF1127 domain-containing protein [Loktanella sp. D2R18]
MANVQTNLATSSILAGRVASFFHHTLNNAVQWNAARITRNSLSKLSARELDDIGLSFGDIHAVATRKAR